MRLNVRNELRNNMTLLSTLISPGRSDLGILIAGENYFKTSTQPCIHIYLIIESKSEWRIQKKIGNYKFTNFNSASQFAIDLPELSALDLLILTDGSYIQTKLIQ